MKRVVVTGMGMVTPLGLGVQHNWARLIAGDSGISAIEQFEPDDLRCKIAGSVPLGKREDNLYNPADWFGIKERRKVSDFAGYARVAAREALADAGWVARNEDDENRAGVIVGSGIGGLEGIFDGFNIVNKKGANRLTPFFIPANIVNSAAGQIATEFGFRGPNSAPATACSSGTHAIGDAARLVAMGHADLMIAGGAESCINRPGLGGFMAMKALSTRYNDNPEEASRPWDKARDGFVMGEGAGIVILEEYQQAKKRNATIYAEVRGYGLSGDAYHIAAPRPDGKGAILSMQAALRDARYEPGQVAYVNAHGTSTPVGDDIELQAVEKVFGHDAKNLTMTSTKSSIGHLLGAAGAVEAIYSIMAIQNSIIPPTLNLHNPSEGSVIDRAPLKAREKKINAALSNSFGFGGTNASIIFSRI